MSKSQNFVYTLSYHLWMKTQLSLSGDLSPLTARLPDLPYEAIITTNGESAIAIEFKGALPHPYDNQPLDIFNDLKLPEHVSFKKNGRGNIEITVDSLAENDDINANKVVQLLVKLFEQSGKPVRPLSSHIAVRMPVITICRSEWFLDSEFINWLNDQNNTTMTHHLRNSEPNEWSDVLVWVDPTLNGEGCSSDMPERYWRDIVQQAAMAVSYTAMYNSIHIPVRILNHE